MDVLFINNRYKVLDRLGSGGMGEVYEVLDRLTAKKVALKRVLRDEYLGAEGSTSVEHQIALAQEFQILASLRHPHVIEVLDYGFDENGNAYFTMPLLEQTVTIKQASVDMDFKGKIKLLIQLLQALAYLYRRGVIHRDLKPSNVLVDPFGKVKLLDFGLALEGEKSQEIAGTLSYLAPEVLADKTSSHLSDLYSVGIIAYEMMTGAVPFSDENIFSLAKIIINQPPDLTPLAMQDLPQITANSRANNPLEDATEVGIELPDVKRATQPLAPVPHQDNPLAQIVGKMLAKNSADRYQDATEVIEALSNLIGEAVPAEDVAIRESYLQAATFVGREEQIKKLIKALGQLPKGSAWLIGGEAGVGKSRLVNELRIRALVKEVTVLRGYAVEGGGLPYQLWRDVLPPLILMVQPTDFEAQVLKEIVPSIDQLLEHGVTGAPSLVGQAGQQRLMNTVVDIFRRLNRPVVLFLEDLHWAGESVELLKLLLTIIAELPVMVVATYRDEEAPHMPTTLPQMELLTIERLTEREISQLSVSMLGEVGERQDVLDLLKRETEGNVFFLVEVVRTLAVEAGRLSAIGEHGLPERVFSDGVKDIVRRRMERLPIDAYPMLRLAAVIARDIDIPLLRQIDPSMNYDRWLNLCADAAVVEIFESRWRFSHDRLRDGFLEGLMPEEVPRLNRLAAQAIERAYPNNPDYAHVLMEHWHQGKVEEKERYYAQIAGEKERSISSHRKAVILFKRALELYPDEGFDKELGYLHSVLGHSYNELGDLNLATDHLTASIKHAESAGDKPTLVAALSTFAWVLRDMGERVKAQEYAEKAVAIARAENFVEPLAYALMQLSSVVLTFGDIAKGRELGEESRELYQQLNSHFGLARIANNFGAMEYLQGNLAPAQQFFAEALSHSLASGDRWMMATALMNSGLVSTAERDYASAREQIRKALQIYRDIEAEANVLTSLGSLAQIDRSEGNLNEALTKLQEVVEIAYRQNQQVSLMEYLVDIGAILVEWQLYQDAMQFLDFARSHPALSEESRQLVEETLTKLRAELGTGYVNQTLALLQKMTLERAVYLVKRIKPPTTR